MRYRGIRYLLHNRKVFLMFFQRGIQCFHLGIDLAIVNDAGTGHSMGKMCCFCIGGVRVWD